jgi:energy-coupling factor transporter ATP-binding protein EcfA2
MIQAIHLSKNYDGKAAVVDLNLDIRPGHIFCLLGANGAGKTTTINLFLNFVQPSEGKALISEQYNPDMGFVFQKNVIWHNPGGYYIWRPKNIDWIRRWDPGLFVKYYHDADQPGNFQQASLYIFPVYIFFQDGSFIEYAFTPTWQNINFNFAPLGLSIAQGDYYYLRHSLRLNTDQSSKLSLSGQFDWGRFYNGKRLTTTAGLRYAPIPHLAFTIDYEYNNLKGIGLKEASLSHFFQPLQKPFPVQKLVHFFQPFADHLFFSFVTKVHPG